MTKIPICFTIPVGYIVPNDDSPIPETWMSLDGQELSRVEYKQLFVAMKKAYGTKWAKITGDGKTTFHIPELYQHIIKAKK